VLFTRETVGFAASMTARCCGTRWPTSLDETSRTFSAPANAFASVWGLE
jgi:hypothetical protein